MKGSCKFTNLKKKNYQPKFFNAPLEPRTRPFGAIKNSSNYSFSSFFGLDLLLKQEESATCFPPKCLTISLEVSGVTIGILGIAAVSLAFILFTGVPASVIFGLGVAALILGLGLLSTGLARHFNYKSILNDEPDYFLPPRHI